MKYPKAAVLLCTYNGSSYVEEQIESILNQSWPNLHLYILDDCSTDSTPEILKRYAGHPKVTLCLNTENLGYPNSFYHLLSKITDADYYAFSDQDDVWFPDKIRRAISRLVRCDPEKPALLYANYYVSDDQLHILHDVKGPARKPDFPYSLYSSSLGLGFTYVLNKKARDLVTANPPEKYLTKDWWIGMCCAAFGNVCYDPRPCALHRRHTRAATPEAKTFYQIMRYRIAHFLLSSEGFDWCRNVLGEFQAAFSETLPAPAQKTLSFFLNDPPSPLQNIRKALYPKRLRYDLIDEIQLRLVFLTGRL